MLCPFVSLFNLLSRIPVANLRLWDLSINISVNIKDDFSVPTPPCKWIWNNMVRICTTLWSKKKDDHWLLLCVPAAEHQTVQWVACSCHSQVEAQISTQNRSYLNSLSLWCVPLNPHGLEHQVTYSRLEQTMASSLLLRHQEWIFLVC